MHGKVTPERAPGTFTLVPLLIFCSATLLGWWYATQELAHSLAYQQQLGEPLAVVGGVPIYRPWQALSWN